LTTEPCSSARLRRLGRCYGGITDAQSLPLREITNDKSMAGKFHVEAGQRSAERLRSCLIYRHNAETPRQQPIEVLHAKRIVEQ
jgi:hypothetical protein